MSQHCRGLATGRSLPPHGPRGAGGRSAVSAPRLLRPKPRDISHTRRPARQRQEPALAAVFPFTHVVHDVSLKRPITRAVIPSRNRIPGPDGVRPNQPYSGARIAGRGKRGSHPRWQRNASCLCAQVTSTWCTNRLESPWAVCCQNGGVPRRLTGQAGACGKMHRSTTPNAGNGNSLRASGGAHRTHLLRGPCARRSTHGAGTDARRPDPLRDSGGGDRSIEPQPAYLHRSRSPTRKPNRSCDRIDCAPMKSVGARESDFRCSART